jgi:hypothetical protein
MSTNSLLYTLSSFSTSKNSPEAVEPKLAKNLFASPKYLLTELTAVFYKFASV